MSKTSDEQIDGWLIHKAGRGWYRPNAEGYTNDTEQAGRYSHADALSYSHPNGWDGPRDGITIKHESDLRSSGEEKNGVEPVAWRVNHGGGSTFWNVESNARSNALATNGTVEPLYALTNTDLSLRAENERLRKERDEWKADAGRRFDDMRKWMDAAYHLRYPIDPTILEQHADRIDCGKPCEHAFYEGDTNYTGCNLSEKAEGCDGEVAEELRSLARAIRTHSEADGGTDWKARAATAEAKLEEAAKVLEEVVSACDEVILFQGEQVTGRILKRAIDHSKAKSFLANLKGAE